MSTPRFHCPIALDAGTTLAVPERTFHHAIRVRRMRAGDPLVVFTGDGREAHGTITDVRRDSADVQIDSIVEIDRESPLDVVLLQAISSGDRMDYTLQKAVELGVGAVVPVMASRSQGLGDARAGKRMDHWREVVISACEQSGRNRIPTVADIATFDRALLAIDAPVRWMLSGDGALRLREAPRPSGRIALLAGPEGGLTGDEEHSARERGFVALTLGPRTLRTETAAVAGLAAMQSLWGDG